MLVTVDLQTKFRAIYRYENIYDIAVPNFTYLDQNGSSIVAIETKAKEIF
jgi:predicted RNase H-like HicB family nuclease